MNDVLRAKLLNMLDAIASESRFGERHATGPYRSYERESRKEVDRLIIEMVEFIDDQFVEKAGWRSIGNEY